MKSSIRKGRTRVALIDDQMVVRWSSTITNANELQAMNSAATTIGLDHPDDIIELDWMDITWGLFDDPLDEDIQLFLMWTDDFAAPPDGILSIQARALWADRQIWRTIGTDAGPTQTMQNNTVYLDREDMDYGPSMERKWLGIFGLSTAQSAMAGMATISFRMQTRQKFVADKNSDWQGYDFYESVRHFT